MTLMVFLRNLSIYNNFFSLVHDIKFNINTMININKNKNTHKKTETSLYFFEKKIKIKFLKKQKIHYVSSLIL